MDKQEVLDTITTLAAAGELTESELTAAFRNGARDDAPERQTRYSQILYFIGGGVAVIGIVAFIAQIWDDLGSAMRVVVTLGSGLAAFTTGIILSRREWLGAAGPAFLLIAALVLPLGMVVTLDEAGHNPEELAWQSMISLVLMAAFLAAHLLFRSVSSLLFSIAYATWAFFAVTGWIIGPDVHYTDEHLFQYRTLAVGLAYLLLAFAFSKTSREALSGILYSFGSMAFLGAALALGGWKPDQNVFWELAFPGLVFLVLYASVHLKSKALLAFGSIFLAGYLIKITNEYFTDSLGWPVALMISGFLLMGVGFVTLRLKRIYLTE